MDGNHSDTPPSPAGDPPPGGRPEGGRRERIERLLDTDPKDVFLRYALALEWVSEGELDRGLEILSALMAAPPHYVPAFHMAGRHLAAAGRIEEARAALRDGIELARVQGESHAAAEMAELLMSLGEFGEPG